MDFKKINIKKYKNLRFFLVLTVVVVLLIYESKESKLISKLDNNPELIQKFNDFKEGGYEKSFNLSKEILESVIDSAKLYIGVPNKVGGISRDSIDASGLIYVSLKSNSVANFPRIAQDMARYGDIITDAEDLKRGDLVFFFNTYEINRLITSVGIYLGDGKFLNSSSKEGVSISDINDPFYWKQKFIFGTRIFNQ